MDSSRILKIAAMAFVVGTALPAWVLAQCGGDAAAAKTAAEVAGSVLAGATAVETTVAQVPGSAAAVVDRVAASATIQAIDAATRDITLLTEDGRAETFTAGPEVINFDQLAVGDRVNVTYTEAVAVYLSAAAEAGAEMGAGVIRAEGVPGGVVAGQGQITAKVLELNKETRQAKLELPGGETRQIKVRDGVDLSQVEVGDTVTVAIAKALAIGVEKPAAD